MPPEQIICEGSGTFRSPVFSLLGAKVNTWELSLARTKVPAGTFAPWNKSSRERMFLGTFVPRSDNISGSELYTSNYKLYTQVAIVMLCYVRRGRFMLSLVHQCMSGLVLDLVYCMIVVS